MELKFLKVKLVILLEIKGKNWQAVMLTGKRIPNKYPKNKQTYENISKVTASVLKKNPATQRTVAIFLKGPVSTVDNIINTDLNLKKTKKINIHRLLLRHIAERRTRCGLLYENHLSGEKWENVVTLDEAWVYLNDCNKKKSNLLP